MNLTISNKEDVDSKNLILSNATFKKNDKLFLESPNEFSPQLILLASTAHSIHGLKYDKVDFDGDKNLFKISMYL
jgi:hypothetical protein